MDLDLGSRAVKKVKYGDVVFDVSIPTVYQVQEFNKKVSAAEENSAVYFLELLIDLGLPKEVCEKLDILQAKKLAEELLGSGKKS